MNETDGKKRKRARESDISTPRKKLQREDATEDDGERVQFVPLQLPPSFPAPRIGESTSLEVYGEAFMLTSIESFQPGIRHSRGLNIPVFPETTANSAKVEPFEEEQSAGTRGARTTRER